MLFESSGKAKNFIKFNGSEISENPETLRIYYCPSCCGYHISSHRYRAEYDTRTENLVSGYKKDSKYDKVEVIIQSSRLCDEMGRLGLTTRKQVNSFLSGLDCLEVIKTSAKCKYYKEKKI